MLLLLWSHHETAFLKLLLKFQCIPAWLYVKRSVYTQIFLDPCFKWLLISLHNLFHHHSLWSFCFSITEIKVSPTCTWVSKLFKTTDCLYHSRALIRLFYMDRSWSAEITYFNKVNCRLAQQLHSEDKKWTCIS